MSNDTIKVWTQARRCIQNTGSGSDNCTQLAPLRQRCSYPEILVRCQSAILVTDPQIDPWIDPHSQSFMTTKSKIKQLTIKLGVLTGFVFQMVNHK